MPLRTTRSNAQAGIQQQIGLERYRQSARNRSVYEGMGQRSPYEAGLGQQADQIIRGGAPAQQNDMSGFGKRLLQAPPSQEPALNSRGATPSNINGPSWGPLPSGGENRVLRQPGIPIGMPLNQRGVNASSSTSSGPRPAWFSPAESIGEIDGVTPGGGLRMGGIYGVPDSKGDAHGRDRWFEGNRYENSAGFGTKVGVTPNGSLSFTGVPSEAHSVASDQMQQDSFDSKREFDQMEKDKRILRNQAKYGLSQNLPAVQGARVRQVAQGERDVKNAKKKFGLEQMTPKQQHLHDAELETRQMILDSIKDPVARLKQIRTWNEDDRITNDGSPKLNPPKQPRNSGSGLLNAIFNGLKRGGALTADRR